MGLLSILSESLLLGQAATLKSSFSVLLKEGGLIVFIPIILFVIATVLFILRFLYLQKCMVPTEDLKNGLQNTLQEVTKNKITEAISICDDYQPSPARAVLRALMGCECFTIDCMRHAVDAAAAEEIPRIQRNCWIIATIGRLGPYLGFIGALWRARSIFQNLSGGGMNLRTNAQDLKGALVISAMGLALSAIVLLYNAILHEKIVNVVSDMEKLSSEMIDFLFHKAQKSSFSAKHELVQDEAMSAASGKGRKPSDAEQKK